MIQFRYIGHVEPAGDWAMSSHQHVQHEFIVINSGTFHVVLGGRTITATTGDILYYAAGTPHAERSDPKNPADFFFVGVVSDSMPGELPVKVHDTHGRLRQLASWYYDDMPHLEQTATNHMDAFATMWIAQYARAAHAPQQALIQEIRTHIRRNISQNLTLDDLAHFAHMSKFHFVRVYKQLSGRTPMEDLRMLRIEYARQLIRTTDLPIKWIAERAGLRNQTQMTRIFQRYLKTTPGQIQRAARVTRSAGRLHVSQG